MDLTDRYSAVSPGKEPDKPSPARLYDYYLNGKFNYQADRDAGERVREKVPEIHYMAHANRGFLQRAAARMAREGVTQFIDIGAGLPTQWNSHEVVHTVNPDAIVVYVDNDPTVLVEAKQILDTRGDKNAVYVKGDLRDPASIIDNPEVRSRLDFSRPIGQIHAAVWHFVSPDSDPYGLMRTYLDAVPSGSYLALSHVTADGQREEKVQRLIDVYRGATEQVYLRTWDEIDRFFEGLDYLPPYEGAEPSLSYCDLWGSNNPEVVRAEPGHTWLPAGVARKP